MTEARARIEAFLQRTVTEATKELCPPGLAAAVMHAVFPGGARVRPLLCLGVAEACGTPSSITLAAAGSIELLHCASLVHDDLPCFDDADVRRGKPTVHCAFGEPTALLAGDALIVLAFETLARAGAEKPRLLAPLLLVLARAVGMSGGLVAGQAWETEANVCLPIYHAAKTGSLFMAAVRAGAASVGHDPARWENFGMFLGEAYQVADDIRDATASKAELGKPVRRDAVLGRPSAVRELGLEGAKAHLDRLMDDALAAIPPCSGREELKMKLRQEVRWFVPSKSAQVAA